jgi:hypothetical protein
MAAPAGRETGIGGQPLQEVPGRFGLGVGRADRVDEGPVAPAPHLAGVEATVGPDQRADAAVVAVGLGSARGGREGEGQLRTHQRQLPQGAELVPAGRGQVDGVGARVPQAQVRPGQAGQVVVMDREPDSHRYLLWSFRGRSPTHLGSAPEGGRTELAADNRRNATAHLRTRLSTNRDVNHDASGNHWPVHFGSGAPALPLPPRQDYAWKTDFYVSSGGIGPSRTATRVGLLGLIGTPGPPSCLAC